MSENITTAMEKQYQDDFILMSMVMGSKLRDWIYWDDVQAEKGYFDLIGETGGQVKQERNEDTIYSNPEHGRVQVTPLPWYDAILVDKTDIPRIIADPKNKYKIAQVRAAGKWMDTQILTQALGTAYTGVDGATSTSFSSDNQVAVASTGMSFAKCKALRKVLYATYDVDPDLPLYGVLTENQAQDLLDETEVGSIDYNAIKPLVDGTMDGVKFMGVNWRVLSTGVVPTDANDYRRVVVWAEGGIGGGMTQDVQTLIDRIPTKTQGYQIWTDLMAGFCRLEQAKVVEVKCLES
jgi:hypothetical protein